MKQLYLLIGMPGAGKGTQAKLLEERGDYRVIRVGEKIRQLAKSDSKLKEEMVSGDLAGSDIVHTVVQTALKEAGANDKIISDGYPRSLTQAQDLTVICGELSVEIIRVLFLHIPETVVHERLKLRARIDDTPDAISERLTIFKSRTMPVIEQYRAKGLVVDINADQSVEAIYRDIVEGIHS